MDLSLLRVALPVACLLVFIHEVICRIASYHRDYQTLPKSRQREE